MHHTERRAHYHRRSAQAAYFLFNSVDKTPLDPADAPAAMSGYSVFDGIEYREYAAAHPDPAAEQQRPPSTCAGRRGEPGGGGGGGAGLALARRTVTPPRTDRAQRTSFAVTSLSLFRALTSVYNNIVPQTMHQQCTQRTSPRHYLRLSSQGTPAHAHGAGTELVVLG